MIYNSGGVYYFGEDYMDRTGISWAIETTGFSAHNEITVAGFLRPPKPGYVDDPEATVYFNTDGGLTGDESADKISLRVEDVYSDPVTLVPCESEAELLKGLSRFASNMDVRKEQLVAYDGEKWHVSYHGDRRDGAALPQVRTRCIKNDVDWVFNNVPFTNLSEVAQYSLNNQPLDLSLMSTDELVDFAHSLSPPALHTHDIDSLSKSEIIYELNDHGFSEHDLESWNAEQPDPVSRTSLRTSIGVDGILLEWDEEEDIDPFDHGGQGVNAYRDRNFSDLILHNLANLVRTSQLTAVVRSYASGRYIDEIRL